MARQTPVVQVPRGAVTVSAAGRLKPVPDRLSSCFNFPSHPQQVETQKHGGLPGAPSQGLPRSAPDGAPARCALSLAEPPSCSEPRRWLIRVSSLSQACCQAGPAGAHACERAGVGFGGPWAPTWMPSRLLLATAEAQGPGRLPGSLSEAAQNWNVQQVTRESHVHGLPRRASVSAQSQPP